MKRMIILLFTCPLIFFGNNVTGEITEEPFPKFPSTDFVDVASWQGYLSTKDYTIMKDEGIRRVVVKLTEGTKYINPYASSQIRNAKIAGLKVSVYHYSRYSSVEEAINEAQYFFQTAKKMGLTTDTIFVNDAEDPALLDTPSIMVSEAAAFRRTLKELGIKNTDLYVSEYWKNNFLNPTQIGDTGWIASYPNYALVSQNWHRNNNAWQWSSQYTFEKILGKKFDINTDYTGYYTDKSFSNNLQNIKILSYKVRPGNTLYGIGEKINVDWLSIAEKNDLSTPYIIFPGEMLKISSLNN